MAGIYIHIPFCSSRCIYCGFYSTTGSMSLQNDYVDALIKEYDLRRDYLHGAAIDTIYIGGGTPSLLSHPNICRIAEHIGVCNGEFTMECNPDDITPELASLLSRIGVNRVSMGVQTFSDKRLQFLRRRHSSSQIVPAISMLRDAGIKNISIDLMFGFPNESIEEWQDDLSKATSLNVEHISAYTLMYEEGTRLYDMLEKGDIEETAEDTSATMYDVLIDHLTQKGYGHYEISNFARKGYQSVHNSSYWNGTPYIGLGAAAHSYDGNSRQWNVANIKEYIKSINDGHIPMEREVLDSTTKYNDLITTALRTRTGIDLSALSETERTYIIRSSEKSIANGLLTIENNHLHLTRKGLFVSDDVMSELIMI